MNAHKAYQLQSARHLSDRALSMALCESDLKRMTDAYNDYKERLSLDKLSTALEKNRTFWVYFRDLAESPSSGLTQEARIWLQESAFLASQIVDRLHASPNPPSPDSAITALISLNRRLGKTLGGPARGNDLPLTRTDKSANS